MSRSKVIAEHMYARMGFMGCITAMVLCTRSQDSVLSVSVRSVYMSYSAGFKGGVKPILGHVKPPQRGEVFRKSRALRWVQTQAIGALDHGFTH